MRHRRTKEIVIELTSMLDVVMILIFAVMIKNSQLVEASNQKVMDLQEEQAEMQDCLTKYEGLSEELANALEKLEEGDLETIIEKLHNAENEVASYEYMDDIVAVYNVGLENRYNSTVRCLTYGRTSDGNDKTHNVKRADAEEWDYATKSLKLSLKEFIDKELEEDAEDKYIYLVFSVDMTKVYSNDYDDVEKILMDFESRHGDRVRYRINDLKGE